MKCIFLRWAAQLSFSEQKTAHYANAASDIEFKFPFGFKELEGIHSRTDFDLKAHQEYSGKKIQYFDSEINKSYTPYVVETSIGLDRMFLALLCYSYCEEELDNGENRIVLKIPPILSPIKALILPLTKKDGMKRQEKSYRLFKRISIVKRRKKTLLVWYRRQDAIGTPFCVTIDHQTLEDGTVTIRDRDSMDQKRINKDLLHSTIPKNELFYKFNLTNCCLFYL